jgi:cation diffusion facilitator CzcD-associated flavoprotein CzcO
VRPKDRTNRVCVIGAGSSGLAAAKNFVEAGFEVDVLEACPDLGGNWNYDSPVARVYRSTHTISSKPGTEYTDYPMPESYPDYPHHGKILIYLRDYADHFDLGRLIEYETAVERVERSAEPGPSGDRCWDVHLAGGEVRRYGALVIANGHNNDPKYPEYPGDFAGEVMHSAQYKVSEILLGRRVLVVGGGNSGCDIVVEVAHKAEVAFHSTRQGYHYLPKYLWGQPSDQVAGLMHALRIPMWIQRIIGMISLRLARGPQAKLGLPKPDHPLFETHPIVNTLLPYFVQHGAVIPKPDIERLDGHRVHFVDGTSEDIDLLIWATGYNITFPFLDLAHLNPSDGLPRLYKHIFHPEYDNLFVVGMITPDSGQFGIVDVQCRAAALYLRSAWEGGQANPWLKKRKRDPVEDLGGGVRYQKTYRHHLEVEHASYTRALSKLVSRLRRGTPGRS